MSDHTPSAARDRLCGRCGHYKSGHGEDGCDTEVRDYGDMDCSCPGWAPAGRTKDGRLVVVCYCGGGDVHAHEPHGGGARILACPPYPVDRPEPSYV